MKHKYKVGRTVTVVNSTHSGVTTNDVGVIVSYEDLGYGIEFYKVWPTTFINEKPQAGKRVLFFEEQDIK